MDYILQAAAANRCFRIVWKNYRGESLNVDIYGKRDFARWLNANEEQDRSGFDWEAASGDEKLDHIFTDARDVRVTDIPE